MRYHYYSLCYLRWHQSNMTVIPNGLIHKSAKSKLYRPKTMKLGSQAYCGYFQVCMKNGPCGPIFRAVFSPRKDQNRSIYRFPSIILKIFNWIDLKLHLQAHWSYICRCVKDRPLGIKFVVRFGPLNESKFRFLNILLKSFPWIHTNIALYAHWSYFRRCVQYGPQRSNFWAILGPKISQNFGVSSLFKNISLVSHQYCFICSLQVLLDMWRILA